VKIGAGIDKLRIANAMEANIAIIHFIGSSSLNAQYPKEYIEPLVADIPLCETNY
jgi:hypothetical protein